MAKLIRIDMGTKAITSGELGKYQKYGGRGLTSMIVAGEVPPTCHPLSAKNKLVIASGLLTGTIAANSGRLSIGAKSPLTGGIKESNVGGTASVKLARLGIRGLVIEGRPADDSLWYLVVNPEGVSLHSAAEFKGLKNYELVERLKGKHGDKTAVISIGPAGEMRLSGASIAVTDTHGRPSRHAGRGGLGAVMGSKGLKAIVIDDKGGAGAELKDKEAFKAAAGVFRAALEQHPVTKPNGGLYTFGTNVLVNILNEAGGLPTRNFTTGKFEGAGKIGGEAMTNNIKERGGEHHHAACTGCIIQCSNVYLDADKQYVTSGLEYETVWAHGANCGIDDLDSIARIDRLCDDYGLDTMELGAAIGVAMAAGVRSFGDAKAALALVNEVGQGTPLGRILGSGAAVTGQVFGVERVPVVKRQSMPAYDPRAVKGVGVTYATSPMGADHTAGYAVATNIMRVGGFVDPLKPEGQADLSKRLQVATAVLDSAGLCVFTSFALLDVPGSFESIPAMLNAQYGTNLTLEDLMAQGREILAAEHRFNLGAGFTDKDDRLPDFFREEKLPPHNVVFDVPDAELDKVVDW
jgi:aldehyde:ferredoxin oxidoreductase